jgi:hypothetical protein
VWVRSKNSTEADTCALWGQVLIVPTIPEHVSCSWHMANTKSECHPAHARCQACLVSRDQKHVPRAPRVYPSHLPLMRFSPAPIIGVQDSGNLPRRHRHVCAVWPSSCLCNIRSPRRPASTEEWHNSRRWKLWLCSSSIAFYMNVTGFIDLSIVRNSKY